MTTSLSPFNLDRQVVANDSHCQIHSLPTNLFVLVMPMYDQIGVPFARLDKFIVHGTNGVGVLSHDFGDGSASFDGVPLDSSEEANVGGGINKYFQIHHIRQFLDTQNQNPFDQNDSLLIIHANHPTPTSPQIIHFPFLPAAMPLEIIPGYSD
mmetsp:Transcript_15980/g.33414  ORF Transcript_15980/g.33414 Transcript_15980/m.33414 type:complete len:153 (-) Transcript_15980:442-900(-)